MCIRPPSFIVDEVNSWWIFSFGKRDNWREVVLAAKKIKLNSSKNGEEGQGVDEGKGSGYSCTTRVPVD